MLAAAPLAAQSQGPLSVIDWLDTQSPPEVARPVVQQKNTERPAGKRLIDEPAVAKTALAPTVAVQPLTLGSAREIGLVPPKVTGLPADLWRGSDLRKLETKIAGLPDLALPAAQSLLYTVLLSEAQAPGGNSAAGDALALARAEKLMQRGALDPAQALIEQAGVATSPAHFDLWMQISLLTGTEDRACDRLAAAPHLTQNYGTRIFCDARAQRWENAALTFGTAKALALLPDDQLALLDRFLDPEGFDNAAPLPVSRNMDPLTFRLFETIGEPVNTAKLPRAYAVADLRDLAGWKAQLEAAERLTRAGALPDNRLLGLYSDRKAAASGGVWDRVRALQRFETALASGSADAVGKTLPTAWREMRNAGLAVTFAELFADQLAQVTLEGKAARTAYEILLLSPAYETAAAGSESADLATQIALGETNPGRPAEIMQGAVYDAFSGAAPHADLVAMVKQGRLGESILEVLTLLHTGTRGNDKALRDALATLRALGLEDTARRAALQTLLLDQ